MAQSMTFGEVLEAVDKLSTKEKHALIDILCRRLAEEGRKRIVAGVKQAHQEFAGGECQPATVDEIMQKIQSGDD